MTDNLTNTQNPKYLPTNDVIFKCLLGNPGNERITKSFLEHITGEEIEEISTNFKLELLKERPKDKQMVADLIAKDKYLQKYIVEMQRKAYDYLPDRFIAYLSKTYAFLCISTMYFWRYLSFAIKSATICLSFGFSFNNSNLKFVDISSIYSPVMCSKKLFVILSFPEFPNKHLNITSFVGKYLGFELFANFSVIVFPFFYFNILVKFCAIV